MALGRALVPTEAQLHSPKVDEKAMPALKPIHWVVGTVLAIAWVAAYWALHRAALRGYEDVFPVYAFAGIGLVSAGWWAAMFARWYSSKWGPSNNRWRGP